MKKKWILALSCLLAWLAGCTDYVGNYDDKYGYLEDESSSSIAVWMNLSSYFFSSSSSLSSSSEESSSSESSSREGSSSSEKGSSSVKDSLSVTDSSSVKSSSSVSSSSEAGFKGSYGLLTDSRDGKTYKTIEIDGLTWMADNLNYADTSSRCYGTNAENCDTSGLYYRMNDALGICPTGWRLPTYGEFLRLFSYANKVSKNNRYGDETAALRKENAWNKVNSYVDPDNTNELGFSAIPTGLLIIKVFESGTITSSLEGKELNATYMTSTIHDLRLQNLGTPSVWLATLEKTGTYQLNKIEVSYASVRCIKDDDRFGTFTDERDGSVYKTVEIGSQTWMAENLKTVVEEGKTYCLDDSAASCEAFGRLYTWDAAAKACPSRWHLPTKADFTTLYSYLKEHDYGYGTGESLMSVGAWTKEGYYERADLWGFNALPVGYYHDEAFSKRKYAVFWSSTESTADEFDKTQKAYYGLYLDQDSDEANLDAYSRNVGASVRCIKD